MKIMGLVSQLSPIGRFIKDHLLSNRVVIDNPTFRLHYRITSTIFLIGCILCTSYSFVDDPIECLVSEEDIQKLVNNYCKISATYTLPKYLHLPVSEEVPYPGIPKNNTLEGQEVKYHSYYQWVPFVLLLQSALFYLPHYVWEYWEKGTMKHLSEGIMNVDIDANSDRKSKQATVVQYLLTSLNKHKVYAVRYMICEVLNLINAVGNMFLIDKFLGGGFLTYGLKVIEFNYMCDKNTTDPMVEVFPRATKCLFYSLKEDGIVEEHHYLCVLAMNVINGKIYIILWFWLIFLSVVSGFSLIYSCANAFNHTMRKSVMEKLFNVSENLTSLLRKLSFGDFFMLHLLGQNIHQVTFNEILNDMCKSISEYEMENSYIIRI